MKKTIEYVKENLCENLKCTKCNNYVLKSNTHTFLYECVFCDEYLNENEIYNDNKKITPTELLDTIIYAQKNLQMEETTINTDNTIKYAVVNLCKDTDDTTYIQAEKYLFDTETNAQEKINELINEELENLNYKNNNCFTRQNNQIWQFELDENNCKQLLIAVSDYSILKFEIKGENDEKM